MTWRGRPTEIWLIQAGPEAPLGERSIRDCLHQALRMRLTDWIGETRAAEPFAIGPYGKPTLSGDGPSFSIAHSGEWGLFAVAATERVGVDIELVRPLTMSADRRRRIVETASAVSATAIEASTNFDERAVLAAWVRLEALAKATGEGIGRLLSRAGIIGGSVTANAAGLPIADIRAGLDLIPLDLAACTPNRDLLAAMAIDHGCSPVQVALWPPAPGA